MSNIDATKCSETYFSEFIKKITSEMLNSIVEVRKVLMSSYGSQQAWVFSKKLLNIFIPFSFYNKILF